MTYLDPRWTRAVDLNEASPNSLVITTDYGTSKWLVSEGPQPIATMISGEHLGSGMMIDVASNWSGHSIEDVSIEVDIDSAYSVVGSGSRLLTIVREGEEISLVMNLDNGRGRQEKANIAISTGLAPCSVRQRVGFTKWRVVKRDGDRVHILHEVDADSR